MKYTTNYNLYKPDYDDTIDVDFLNKNMDVLDNQLNGLDYVQNVNTSNNGLTFIKRNGDTIPVSLNYLPITGGSVTGDTEITGTLTNKGKDVGRLFNDSPEGYVSLIDWEKMKNVYGSNMSEYTYTKNGKNVTKNLPTWTVKGSGDNYPVYGIGGKDIYLTEDFTNYDILMFVFVKYNNFCDLCVNWEDTKCLDWRMRNFRMLNLNDGETTWNIYGYDAYGTGNIHRSTKRKWVFNQASSVFVNVYGVKYAGN